MIRVKTKVTDKDMGFKKLAAELSGAGTITLGVQGKEAEETHGDGPLTVGQVAAIHELGIRVPERSWLRSWMDVQETRMMSDMARAYQQVIKGQKSRKAAMADVGYQWVVELRDNIRSGKIRPALAAATVARKGHHTPLLDGGQLMNSITYKLYLNNIKGINDLGLREAVRKGPQ